MFRSFVLLAICSVVTSQQQRPIQPQQINDISDGISRFAYKFYKTCADLSEGNVLVSPYSMATTLSLLYQGASEQTLNELQNGLELHIDQPEASLQFEQYSNAIKQGAGSSVFNAANNIYLRRGDSLNPNFRAVAENQYSSEVQQVDFNKREETARKINKDVEKKTGGKITDLVQPDQFTGDSRLFFVNAVYFKGGWELPFQRNLTQIADFTNADGRKVPVPFMHAEKDYPYSFFRNLNASMVQLKYLNSNFSLLILLPNVHTTLRDLEKNMAGESIADLVSRLVSDEVEIDIPRFSIQYEIKAKDVLTQMHMGHMFTRNAKLGHILNTREPLKVSDVVHKAVIEVNEKGSTAAAASGVGIVNYSFPPRFRADRPFLFYIWDQSTNTPIFSGRVNNLQPSDI